MKTKIQPNKKYKKALAGKSVAIATTVLASAVGAALLTTSSFAATNDCNPKARAIEDAVCLQDMNPLVKYSMEVGEAYTLKDSRDDETYIVKKLDDGNVWLADNLRLGSKRAINLTPEDTNIANNFTLPGDNWDHSFTQPKISIDYKYYDYSSDIEGGDWTQMLKGSNALAYVGVYYNYCAATAGTSCESFGMGDHDFDPDANPGSSTDVAHDAEYDICPANWRMPTGNEDGEYGALMGYYRRGSDYAADLRLFPSGRVEDPYYTIGHDGYFWTASYFREGGSYPPAPSGTGKSAGDTKGELNPELEMPEGFFISALGVYYYNSFDPIQIAQEEHLRIKSTLGDVEAYIGDPYSRNDGLSIRCLAKSSEFGSGDYRWLYGNEYDGEEKDTLALEIDLELKAFLHLEVDGEELDEENYELEEGSTVITFKNAYLDTLDEGTYAVKAVYIEDVEVETEFKIEKIEEEEEAVPIVIPDTGTVTNDDNTEMSSTTIVVMASAAVATIVFGGALITRLHNKKMTFKK